MRVLDIGPKREDGGELRKISSIVGFYAGRFSGYEDGRIPFAGEAVARSYGVDYHNMIIHWQRIIEVEATVIPDPTSTGGLSPEIRARSIAIDHFHLDHQTDTSHGPT
jgi:hypothetical protein